MQGVGAIPLIQRESSPFSSSPMDLKEQGQMVSFLNTNFVRQRIQHRLPSAASRRRSSVFLLREDGTCPTTPTFSKQKLHEEVDRLLQPFEEVLPTSLGRKAESTEDLNRSFQSDQGGEGGRKPAENPAREWNLDVKELEDKENSISPPFTPSPSNSAVMRIRNALPIIGLQLLRPYLHSPLGMKDLSKTFQFLQLVAQMTVWLTEHSGVRRLLSKIQNVSLVIAALCHDLAHEGFNNQFHLSSGSEIAMMYNDRSVLENFHAAKAFLILKTTGCELLHFEFASALKLRISAPGFASSMTPSESSVLLGKVTGEENEKDGEKEKEQQDSADGIWMVTRACLKAADLGHSAKPWHIHFARSLCVTLEFFHQGDTERALGLPISPLCNRRETTPAGLCKSQVGFLNFVCRRILKLNSAASCVSLNETLTQLKPHQPKRSSSQKVTLLVPPQEDTQQQQQQQILQREASPSSSIERRVEGLLKEVERVELEGLARDGLVEIPSLGPGG
uniref:Phosphodiesterase n=1 Tax=Chromera velia CCMP2878 TaxID=1169474 RepID=A0A0K6SBH2_9ALVE|eukprot:Cvel_13388.t2-p1 / transcript=Cvel_13388.t2 / gene=Cvel_13388 / organism=Chromera_velia_CCMP2878 / gene_product=Calcium/calmodulin-dependent 3',5'-cyclic, putative / transcript_product=Calcium/calmodulin-dependent 3',5'-cyclic, putative / location=Cvel_scaffold911:45568-50536(+) / protein_length=504 / sequence_SO=supercontig / SO=protein_coding / is_pseudo=false